MRSYNQDLRDRVISAKADGDSTEVVSKRFKVSYSCVNRWWLRFTETGLRSAFVIGGNKKSRIANEEMSIREIIKHRPDITVNELVVYCASELGIKISRNALWWQLDRMGLSFKKNSTRIRARQRRRASKA